MIDIVAPSVRSRMMAGIRSRDTRPEMQVRRFLHRKGFRYRLSKKGLPGKPDLVLTSRNAVIYVHGCFWHGHSGCPYFKMPATRPNFWEAKLAANVSRDARNLEAVTALGWRVAIVWECALRNDPSTTLRRLESFLRSERRHVELGQS